GSITGTASVTIAEVALSSLVVSPANAMLRAGEARDFTVIARNTMGDVVPVLPAWSVVAGGGTIDTNGRFTAGAVPGTFTNTVRASASGLTAFATIVVTPGPPLTLEISPPTSRLEVGARQLFRATA